MICSGDRFMIPFGLSDIYEVTKIIMEKKKTTIELTHIITKEKVLVDEDKLIRKIVSNKIFKMVDLRNREEY